MLQVFLSTAMCVAVSVRITERDKELLKKVCTMRGEDVSDLVRRAIRIEFARLGFLTFEEKKALGITKVSHAEG